MIVSYDLQGMADVFGLNFLCQHLEVRLELAIQDVLQIDWEYESSGVVMSENGVKLAVVMTEHVWVQILVWAQDPFCVMGDLNFEFSLQGPTESPVVSLSQFVSAYDVLKQEIIIQNSKACSTSQKKQ